MLPVVFLSSSRLCSSISSERMATLPDTHTHNVHDDVRHHHQILISPVLFYTQTKHTAKFKDRQISAYMVYVTKLIGQLYNYNMVYVTKLIGQLYSYNMVYVTKLICQLYSYNMVYVTKLIGQLYSYSNTTKESDCICKILAWLKQQ